MNRWLAALVVALLALVAAPAVAGSGGKYTIKQGYSQAGYVKGGTGGLPRPAALLLLVG
jgi:hypothetical protein